MLPLRELLYRPPSPQKNHYPFNLAALKGLERLPFPRPITFFIGDNGSGKSTLLEALAVQAGFHAEGGSQHAQYDLANTNTELATALRLVWNRKVTNGFFFRAESFFRYATYLDELAQEGEAAYASYDGRSLHQKSHGESFLSLFQHRLQPRHWALYLFDEPESALSITGQLALLRWMHEWAQSGHVQAIIATHSPVLLAYPNAAIWDFDRSPLVETTYHESTPYQVTRSFLDAPERFLERLWHDD